MAKITDKGINRKAGAKDIWMYNTIIWGHGTLEARITAAGERLFYFRYITSSGDRDRLPIGTYDKDGANGCMTLADAIDYATTLASLHKSGICDIREHLAAEAASRKAQLDADQAKATAEKAAADAEAARIAARKTVRDIFDQWMATDVRKRKDGGAEVRRKFNADVFPVIGDRAVADLTKGDITQVIDRISARNRNEAARDTLAVLKQMLDFAVDREYIASNPASALKAKKLIGPKKVRTRVLSEDEIRELATRLPAAGLLDTTEAAIWIAFSTCCRIGELLAARWEHIDLKKGTWFMPDTKNGNAHTVQLSDFSIAKFQILKSITGNSEWCYPNPKNTDHVSDKTVTKQIGDRQVMFKKGKTLTNRRNDNSLVLDGGKKGKWTPHDLRRTGATMMTALGVLPAVAEKCLNHTEENKVTRTYLQHSYTNEMREAWRLLGERLALITDPDNGNVIVGSFGTPNATQTGT